MFSGDQNKFDRSDQRQIVVLFSQIKSSNSMCKIPGLRKLSPKKPQLFPPPRWKISDINLQYLIENTKYETIY